MTKNIRKNIIKIIYTKIIFICKFLWRFFKFHQNFNAYFKGLVNQSLLNKKSFFLSSAREISNLKTNKKKKDN